MPARAAGPATSRQHLILVVALPDRPGALGAVASRIGALGTDITDVAISDRDEVNVDVTFHLDLPEADVDVLALLRNELAEVDGVSVRSEEQAACCERPGHPA